MSVEIDMDTLGPMEVVVVKRFVVNVETWSVMLVLSKTDVMLVKPALTLSETGSSCW